MPYSLSQTFTLLGCCVLATLGGAPLRAEAATEYGPRSLSYDLPKDAGSIWYAGATTEGDGQSPESPASLSSILPRLRTGDAVILRGGTYRTGSWTLNQSITLQPYRDETVRFSGTEIAAEWTKVRGGLWRCAWDNLFPDEPHSWWRRKFEKDSPLHLFNGDMV